MPINFSVPQAAEFQARLIVFGVGGGGGNAVNNMIAGELQGVEFVVANTDAQHLEKSHCQRRIQLGANLTRGLGAGMKPDIGRAAAEESADAIAEHLHGCHMAFIAAGMGGGTGTGAAPVVARIAKEMGILTVGVVTKPFMFEGTARMRLAENGIRELQHHVDALIVIPNQNLFRVVNEKTGFVEALKLADNVLHLGVRGITDLIVNPGIVNLDFADVKSAMSETGKAMMGTGEAEGERRALEAAERAIANPLLDETSMKGAHGLIINITGGPDLTLYEVDEAAQRVKQEVDADADIYIGTALDERMAGRLRVSVVATGIDREAVAQPAPQTEKVVHLGPRPAMAPAAAPVRGFVAYSSGGAAAVRIDPAPAVAAAPTMAMPMEAPAALAAAPVQAEIPMPATQQPLPAAPMTDARPQSTRGPNGEFLPPQSEPVKARPAQAARPEPAVGGNPFGEAAFVNAGAPPEATRRKSLFESIIKAGRPAAAAPAERVEPAIHRPAAGAVEAAAAPRPAPAPTMFDKTESAERPASPPAEDPYEIPAFLRRQAN